MRQINEHIVVADNIMPTSVVNMVLDEYKECGEWINATLKDGDDLNIRNCQTINISFPGVIKKNSDIRLKIDESIFACATQAIGQYKAKFLECNIARDSGYELLRYKEGQFYTTHTDFFRDVPRSVSCSFALNDDYEGGEFAFFDRELVYKLKKGSCIMFPSNFMYPHEIMPVISGTRYSIVTWFV